MEIGCVIYHLNSGRITRISKDTAVQILASFNVFVPHQAPPSLLNPFPNASASELEFITRLLTVVISFFDNNSCNHFKKREGKAKEKTTGVGILREL